MTPPLVGERLGSNSVVDPQFGTFDMCRPIRRRGAIVKIPNAD
jgi:hypothetical protein